ncbi:MAG: pectin acetylesterase-family hydrolase [Actinomycetota bacterium]
MRRFVIVLCAIGLTAAACGSDESDEIGASEPDSTPTTTAAPTSTTAAPTTTATPTTTTAAPTTTTTAAPLAWRQVMAGDDCACSDGSPYSYWVREADPDKVMLFFDGGGACFSAETCNPETATYSVQADDDLNEFSTGVFDLDNPANPLGDWSMIFMPYCTGDVHIGTNADFDYGDGVVVNHTGFLNASKGLDELVTSFGGADQILVTGSSAGGVPTPLFGGLVADAFPEADIVAMPDASGGYPSNPLLNPVIGGLWGTEGAIPDWESTAGATVAEFGIPDLYVYAGTEYPQIRWGRFDHAFDGVQTDFSALAGLEDSSVKAVLDINEALVEDAGIDLPVYIAPGTDHTIMGRPDFYDLAVDGTLFVDWLADLLAGEPIDDVVCTECDGAA